MKKLNKLFAILVAMAMVLSLSVVSAFAATENSEGADVVKKIVMPKGVNIPADASVVISATLDTIDGVAPAANNTSGVIANKTLDLSSPLMTDKTSSDTEDYYYFHTGNLVNKDSYTHGGQYVYTVKETADLKASTLEGGSEADENTKTYEMTVNVKSDKTIDSVYVKDGATKKTILKEVTSETVEDYAANGVSFTNKISIKRTSEDYNNSAFGVKKIVQDNTNGVSDKGTKFAMKIKVDLPASNQSAKYVYNGETKTITEATQEIEIELADGETLYFTEIPVGAVVTAVETDSRAAEDASAAYQKSGEVKNDTNITQDNKVKAEITNKRNDTDNTGILVSNLPYIVLALVAIGGMVAYVVIRRRNADEA